jgi:catechol 2,3-dioxygenase
MSTASPALHHVTFKTARLDEMIAWYGVVIGARVMFRDAYSAWTTNDEANHRIAFLAFPGLKDDPDKNSRTGMHHSAFEFRDFKDLMASYRRLRDHDIAPDFCLDHGLTTSIYYRDPDGNFVELQCDAFGDWKASSEFVRTSKEFAANLIGVFFDPEKVWAAHRAGSDFPTLHEEMRAGGFVPETIPNIGLPN